MMLESIRQDPEYATATTPAAALGEACHRVLRLATSGGTLLSESRADRAHADKLVDARLAAPMTSDANDFLWQWGSSADYDASPDLEKIKATLLLVNAADDERNPPETGVPTRQ